MANEGFSEYFGHPDAAREGPESIVPDHVVRGFEKSIKCGDRLTGKQVIVGLKGSGKTAVRRYLEGRDGIPTWNLDSDHQHLTMDTSAALGRSGALKNAIAFRLLTTFGSHLMATPEAFGLPKHENTIAETLTGVGERLRTILGEVDLRLPFVQINLGRLLQAESAPAVTKATKELIDGLLAALGKRRVYLMIDDADDIFQGLEKNPAFVEGLARAMEDVNRLAGNRIHALLFLKQGIWRAWYERQQELDRINHIIQEISWDDRLLIELIARRIARIHKTDIADGDESLWKREFDWTGTPSFDTFSAQFTQLCVSGPRDMIALANASKEVAGAERITAGHLAKVTPKYSEGKLYGINADFGGVYEDISQFIDMVFQGCPPVMSGRDAAEWIYVHGLTNARVDDHFKGLSWYSSAAKERLLAMMFEVGLFGRLRDDDTPEYAIQRTAASPGELLESMLIVHPAFQQHLSVRVPAARKGRKRG
jgi:hypothetical protein